MNAVPLFSLPGPRRVVSCSAAPGRFDVCCPKNNIVITMYGVVEVTGFVDKPLGCIVSSGTAYVSPIVGSFRSFRL